MGFIKALTVASRSPLAKGPTTLLDTVSLSALANPDSVGPLLSSVTTSGGIKNALPVIGKAVLVLVGGGQSQKDFLIDRAGERIGSLEIYCVVAALIMNAALCLYSYTPHNPRETDTKVDKWITIAFGIFNLISVISSTYCTVIFTLLALYLKTCLGFGMDNAFFDFLDNTVSFRVLGFKSFMLSLWTFMVSFSMSVFLCVDGRTRFIVGIPAALGSLWTIHQFELLKKVAGRVIFGVGG